MILNYLKLTIRQLIKQKSFTLINLAGLSVGLTVAILIFLWIRDELRYDMFHNDTDQIYRLSWHAKYGANEWNIPIIPVPVGPTLEQEFPEVEFATHWMSTENTFQKGQDFIRESEGAYVDQNFFKVFTSNFIEGNPDQVLVDPNSMVITRSMANRYFPQTDVMGRTVMDNYDNTYQVTGIVEDWPHNSHIQFDYLLPIHTNGHVRNRKDAWGAATVMTYIKTIEDANISDISKRFDQYVLSKVLGDDFDRENNFVHFPFQPLSDIHLKSDLQMDVSNNGDISYVYLFGLIGFLVLVLACINFTNLSTARSLIRAKEVGIRKMLGSSKPQLVRQFFLESLIYVSIASSIAMVLVYLILPYFNSFTQKKLFHDLQDPSFFYWIISFMLLTSLLAGGIPALTITRFKPIQVLKGRFIGTLKGNWLRRSLVTSQFVISISLIAGTIIIKKQMDFLQNQKLGFDKEQVLVIEQADALNDRANLFVQQINQMSWAVNTSSAQYLPGDEYDSMGFVPEQPANFEHTSINYNFVDDQHLNVLNLELRSGRNFDSSRPIDSLAFLINEQAAKMLGWEQPLGKKLSYDGIRFGPVLGIIKNFHYESMHSQIDPLILIHSQRKRSNLSIKIATTDVSEVLVSVEGIWKEHAPKAPLNFSFLDDDFNALYLNERKMSTLFSWSTLVAIFIACLGLYGLALFNAERRIKEIGVRKILGASVPNILRLMATEYLYIIILALILSIPFTWYLANQWLMEFAFRTTLSLWVFVIAGMLTLLVAILTVSFQSIKIAYSRPVNSLRVE